MNASGEPFPISSEWITSIGWYRWEATEFSYLFVVVATQKCILRNESGKVECEARDPPCQKWNPFRLCTSSSHHLQTRQPISERSRTSCRISRPRFVFQHGDIKVKSCSVDSQTVDATIPDMAEPEKTNTLAATFPSPPPFWKYFTPQNKAKVEELRAAQDTTSGSQSKSTKLSQRKPPILPTRILDLPSELLFLQRPLPPTSGIYRIFGEPYTVWFRLPK